MSLQLIAPEVRWAPLSCKNMPDGVQLCYDFSSSVDGLLLAVTDLTRVWDLSLSQEQIVDEAHQQNCSIDPSESRTQLRTLLSKLKQSLVEGNTELGSSSAFNGQSIRIRTRLKLPPPLQLLIWTFPLRSRDSAHLANVVTLPLLREAALMNQQVQTLFQVIKDKDHVLSKLLDKIDNSAIDLSLIFPGITGMRSRKQRIDVSEASKHVPGMAPFNETSWKSSFAKNHSRHNVGGANFSNILTGLNVGSVGDLMSIDWTQGLPSLDALPKSDDSETDEDAQKHEPTKHPQPDKPSAGTGDSATESDFEDLADTPRRRRQARPQVDAMEVSPPPVKWKHTSSSSPTPVNTLRPLARKHKDADSSSDSHSDRVVRPVTKVGMKTSSKIGTIGGKRKPSPVARSPTPSAASSDTSKPSRRIGALGGRKAPTKSLSKSPVPVKMRSETPPALGDGVGSDTASSASTPPASHNRSSEPPTKDDTPPLPVADEQSEPEESVEDKAKRKREELKRTQAQASAGLAKKKARRF